MNNAIISIVVPMVDVNAIKKVTVMKYVVVPFNYFLSGDVETSSFNHFKYDPLAGYE